MGKKYAYQDVKNIVEEVGYELLSKEEDIINEKGFVYAKTKIRVKCPNENHEPYDVSFYNFKGYKNKKGSRCSRCSKYRGFSYEFVKEYFEKEGYELLSEKYENANKKLEIICPNGHKWNVEFSNFRNNNQRCPHCMAENRRYDYEFVKNHIESFGYKLLSTEYINNKTNIIVQCPNGHEPYQVIFSAFKNQGQRCPHCARSKGEERIESYLRNKNINFIPQYKFDNLLGVSNGLLSYDFYLPQYDLLIEYQGEYHDGTARKQTEKQFERQQEHDRRKREYTEKNGYKLLEIWYWDFDNIEEILNKELK